MFQVLSKYMFLIIMFLISTYWDRYPDRWDDDEMRLTHSLQSWTTTRWWTCWCSRLGRRTRSRRRQRRSLRWGGRRRTPARSRASPHSTSATDRWASARKICTWWMDGDRNDINVWEVVQFLLLPQSHMYVHFFTQQKTNVLHGTRAK